MSVIRTLEISICKSDFDFITAVKVFKDYVKWLDIDLCFQNVAEELELFNDFYSMPKGFFLIARSCGEIAGVIGCRRIDSESCEMKRLYVYEKFQGQGIGKKLCQELFSIAIAQGYKKMRLDTIAKLEKAISLYEAFGFYDIPPYRENPDKTVRFMEIDLMGFGLLE